MEMGIRQGNMENNRSERVVLCYGDSNTYGQMPNKGERFDRSVRWPRELQRYLGDKYYVVEEGQGGRLTDLEDPDPTKASRNGWSYFAPCLDSHNPDIVVIMLGTNDAQKYHSRSARDIANSVEKFVKYCTSKGIEAVLVAPAAPDSDGLFDEHIRPKSKWKYDNRSVVVLKELPLELEKIAIRNDVEFVDANLHAKVGEDGLHWTRDSHLRFSKIMAELIKKVELK